VPRRLKILLWANVAWMAFVWVNRMRNIAADDLSGASLAWASGAALAAVLGAVLLGVTASTARLPRVAAAVLVIHAGWWVVRAALIATADHSVGFIVVHLVLAAVSIGLAAAALSGLAKADLLGLGERSGRGVSSSAWDNPSPSSRSQPDAEESSAST
jgi:hypothetical protein